MAKRKPMERDVVMEKARGAVTLLNSRGFNSERTKVLAFLSFMHPEKGPDEIVQIANAMRDTR